MARLTSIGFELNSTTSGVEVTTWNFLSHTAPTIVTTPTASSTSGFAMRCSPSANQSLVDCVIGGGKGTLFVGAWINFSVLPTANLSVLDLGTLSAAYGAIFIDSSGKFGVNYNVGSTSTYDTARSAAITTNTWHYIELEIIATSANAQTVVGRLDGVQIASKSGTLTATANSLTLAAWGAGCRETGTCTVFFDDVVVNDSTGTSENTWPYTTAGPNLAIFRPSGTGDSNTFSTQTGGTAGSANNYTRVQEVTPDGATTFNGSKTTSQSDLYEVSCSTGSVPSGSTIGVVAVGLSFAGGGASNASSVELQIEKTSGGTISRSTAQIPGSTGYLTNTTGTNAAPYPFVLYTDPDGGAWTTTTLASMQIGGFTSLGNTNTFNLSAIWAYVDYTPSAGSTISATGIASTAALGVPTLTPGEVILSPTGLGSTAALGSPTVSVATQTISPTGIASSAALGSPTLSPGAVSISPTGIASTLGLGSPTLSPGAVTISATGIASTSALGAPTLSSNYMLSPTGIASTTALGSPTLSPGGVSISPTGIASHAALGSPTLASTYSVSVTGIASTAALGSPTLAPGTVTLSPTGRASTAALGAPTLSSAYTLGVSAIASTATLGSPTVAIGASSQTINTTGLASTLLFGASTLIPGTVSISAASIASTAALGTVTLTASYSFAPSGIASTNAFGSPTLSSGVVVLSPTGIASTLVFGHVFVGVLWPQAPGGPTVTWVPDGIDGGSISPASGASSASWAPGSITSGTISAADNSNAAVWIPGDQP